MCEVTVKGDEVEDGGVAQSTGNLAKKAPLAGRVEVVLVCRAVCARCPSAYELSWSVALPNPPATLPRKRHDQGGEASRCVFLWPLAILIALG